MAKAYIFLTAGFEETEAVAVVDALRRCGVDASTVSVGCSAMVAGSRGITVAADCILDGGTQREILAAPPETALILPGGNVVAGYENSDVLEGILRGHDAKGGFIAAICIAPTYLAGLGLLNGKTAVCYPGAEDKLAAGGAELGETDVCESDNYVTSKGPGTAGHFGFAVAARLVGDDAAKKASDAFLLRG